MTDEKSRASNNLRTVALLAGTGIGVLQLNGVYAAEPAAETPAKPNALEQVTVFGQKDAYKMDASSLRNWRYPDRCRPVDQHHLRTGDAGSAVVDMNPGLKTVRA